MAMQMTHIRFALDLAQQLGVEHVHEYLLGTIYPDSRYFTKISRDVTHRQDVPSLSDDQEKLSDFEKGWATHLCYDETAHAFLMDLFPGAEPPVGLNETWIKISAAKLIEDRQSYVALGDHARIIEELTFSEGARGEKVEDLQRYLDAQREIYRGGASTDAYMAAFRAFGITDDLTLRLRSMVDAIERDPLLMKKLVAIYPSVLEMTLERKDW